MLNAKQEAKVLPVMWRRPDRVGAGIRNLQGAISTPPSPVVGPPLSGGFSIQQLPLSSTAARRPTAASPSHAGRPCRSCQGRPWRRASTSSPGQLLGQGLLRVGADPHRPSMQGLWRLGKAGLDPGATGPGSDRAGTPSPTSCSVAVPAMASPPPPSLAQRSQAPLAHQQQTPLPRCQAAWAPLPSGGITGRTNRRRAQRCQLASLGPWSRWAQSTAIGSFSLPGPSSPPGRSHSHGPKQALQVAQGPPAWRLRASKPGRVLVGQGGRSGAGEEAIHHWNCPVPRPAPPWRPKPPGVSPL